MSRFSLSFKFGLLLLGFVLATSMLVGLFWNAGTRVGVDLFELKDHAFPEYESLSAAQDSFKDFTGKIEEVVGTGEGGLEGTRKIALAMVGHLEAAAAISTGADRAEALGLRDTFRSYDPQAIELATLAIKSEQQQGGLAGLSSDRIRDLSGRVADLRTKLETGLDRIVKERRATFAALPAEEAKRPPAATAWSNLALAGDWTQTGLPATIEGAIRSVNRAAEQLRRTGL